MNLRPVDLRCDSCGRPYDANVTGNISPCDCGNSTFSGKVTITPTPDGDVHYGGLVEADPRREEMRQ